MQSISGLAHPFPSHDEHHAVYCLHRETLSCPVRPTHAQVPGLFLAQAKVRLGCARAAVAEAVLYFSSLHATRVGAGHEGAEGVPALLVHGPYTQPVPAGRRSVHEQVRWAIAVDYQDVDPAVTVHVAEGCATAGGVQRLCAASSVRGILKPATGNST